MQSFGVVPSLKRNRVLANVDENQLYGGTHDDDNESEGEDSHVRASGSRFAKRFRSSDEIGAGNCSQLSPPRQEFKRTTALSSGSEGQQRVGKLKATFKPFVEVPIYTELPVYLGKSANLGTENLKRIPAKQVRILAQATTAMQGSNTHGTRKQPGKFLVKAKTLGINPCSVSQETTDAKVTQSPHFCTSTSSVAAASGGPSNGVAAGENWILLLQQQCEIELDHGDILFLHTDGQYGFRLVLDSYATRDCAVTHNSTAATQCTTPMRHSRSPSSSNTITLSPPCTVLGRFQRRRIETRRVGAPSPGISSSSETRVRSRFFSPQTQTTVPTSPETNEDYHAKACGDRSTMSPSSQDGEDSTSFEASPERILDRYKYTPSGPSDKKHQQSSRNVDICSICQAKDDCEQGELPCKHSFCFECIYSWAKISNTCCLCKSSFVEINKISRDGHHTGTVQVEPRQNSFQEEEEVVEFAEGCMVCDGQDREDQLLLCDSCDAAYHTFCLDPVIVEIPEGDWYCPPCADEIQRRRCRENARREREAERIRQQEEALERLRRRRRTNQLVVLDSDDED